MADKNAAPADDLVEAVVRRGTVVHGGSPGVRDVQNPDPKLRDRFLVEPSEPVHAGPGETVKLTKAEVDKLRASGVLEDPDAAPPPPTGAGPSFGLDEGPSVKET